MDVIDVLEAALFFFGEKMKGLYDLLMIDPEVYQGGEVWKQTMTIFNSILGIGFTIIMVSGYLGIIGSLENIYMAKKPEILLSIFGMVTIAGGILSITPKLLLLIVHICQKVLKMIGGPTLENASFLKVPGYVVNATKGLDTLQTVLAFVIVFALFAVIGVSCIGILIMAYGRMLKLYMYIAISPLTIPWMASRTTQSVALNYIKTFIVTAAEGIVIVLAVIVFSILFNTDGNGSGNTPKVEYTFDEQGNPVLPKNSKGEPTYYTDEQGNYVFPRDKDGNIVVAKDEDGNPIVAKDEDGKPIVPGLSGNKPKIKFGEEDGESPLAILAKYVLETALHFSVLFAVIKSSETEFKKIFGI